MDTDRLDKGNVVLCSRYFCPGTTGRSPCHRAWRWCPDRPIHSHLRNCKPTKSIKYSPNTTIKFAITYNLPDVVWSKSIHQPTCTATEHRRVATPWNRCPRTPTIDWSMVCTADICVDYHGMDAVDRHSQCSPSNQAHHTECDLWRDSRHADHWSDECACQRPSTDVPIRLVHVPAFEAS